MTAKNETSKLVHAVKQVGMRAVKAVERAAGGGPWTTDAILRAADWLEKGAKEGGLGRPWPNLATRLRNLAAAANGSKEKNPDAPTPAPADAPARATKAKTKKATTEPTLEADAPTPAPVALVLAPVDTAALPFSEFAERYLKHLEKEGKSRGTVFSYSLDLNVAERHFGETRDVKSITTEDVAAYFESDAVTKNRGGGPKNPITVSKLRRTLRMALEWGAKAGWLWTAPIPVTAKVREAADAARAAHECDARSAD